MTPPPPSDAVRSLPETIYIVGFMSSGKSNAGRALAGLLGYDFIDTDIFLESRFRLRVSDMFARDGEEAFRKKERIIAEELAGYPHAVIATGGGLPVHHDNMRLLTETGCVLYLRYGAAELARRLELTKRTRPMVAGLSGAALQDYVTETLAARAPVYERAHCIVDMEALAAQGISESGDIARHLLRLLSAGRD